MKQKRLAIYVKKDLTLSRILLTFVKAVIHGFQPQKYRTFILLS